MADIPISKLASMLKPYILDLIGAATGGMESFAPSPHDLSSSHHSGSIADAQAPQFLKTDGSRQLLGNLAVATGITVDGVDISVLKGDFDTHVSAADPHNQYVRKANADSISAVHTFNPASPGAPFALGANAQSQVITGLRADELNKSISAGTGLTGGGALTANRTLGIDLTASLTWTGNEAFQGGLTARHILPEVSDGYDLGAADKLWRRIFASEFDTYVLKANAVSVIGGRMMVAKGEGAWGAGVVSSVTQIDFATAMTANDIVLFRTLGQVEYMQVGSLVSGTTYNVTRNLDGSGANDWPAGAVWINLGYNGTGRIELDAESTPRISIRRQGAAYNTLLSEPVRIGDLNGWDDVGTERYGIGLGDFTGGNFLRYDPGGGFLLKAGAGGVRIDEDGINLAVTTTYDPTGSISFGSYMGIGTYYLPGGDFYFIMKNLEDSFSSASFQYRFDYDGVNAYHGDEWIAFAGQSGGRPASLSIKGYVASAAASSYRAVIQATMDDFDLRKDYASAQTGAPSIMIEDAAAHAPTPAAGLSRINVRNGSPFIKRSSGSVHPLVAADDLLKELPYVSLWGYMRRTPSGSTICPDLAGGGNNLSLVSTGLETAAGQLGNGHSFAQIYFNGSSSYMAMNPATAILPTYNHHIVGGWFYLDEIGRGHGLIQLGHTTQLSELYINSGNTAVFRVYHGSTGYIATGGISAAGWHFIAGHGQWWSSASYYIRVFIDGTWYTYSGSAPTVGGRTPVGDVRVGLAYNNSYYLKGRVWRAFNCYPSGLGKDIVEEYYALTKHYFQA